MGDAGEVKDLTGAAPFLAMGESVEYRTANARVLIEVHRDVVTGLEVTHASVYPLWDGDVADGGEYVGHGWCKVASPRP